MKTVKHLLSAKGGEVYSTRPAAKVIDALKLMADRNVGALVVLDGMRLVGIFSERDYARKVILHGKSSADVLLQDVMTRDVITVPPSCTVEECMALVTSKRIRHLPVCEGEELVGVISIGDLVKEVIAQQAQTIKELESYIHS
jgi:CBS domain-containing protein